MLAHLAVHNLGIIAAAEVDPAPGLTVITGETGAGKTLLLGSVRQLLGEPADSGLVGHHGDEATIDGLFATGEEEMGITRVIPREGRSRTRIDGAVVSADTVRRTTSSMVEVVGQHDQLSLRRSEYLRRTIDSLMGQSGSDPLAVYGAAWAAHEELVGQAQMLGGDTTALARELDLAKHQAEEIRVAGLTTDLDERIEGEVSRLRNIEEIRENLAASSDLAERVVELTGEIVARMRKISVFDSSLDETSAVAESFASLSQEMASALRRSLESQEGDPATLNELEAQLTSLGDLKRKYGKTLEEVMSFGDNITDRALELERLISDAATLESRLETSKAAMLAAARDLTEARSRIADSITEKMLVHLTDLGMGTARTSFRFEPIGPRSTGADRMELLFSSGEHSEPRPVSDVASGGELSRLVLAFRLASSEAAKASLVFDEVDAGIGGQTALAMGHKLAALAKTNQVLCVTHLAQVAAMADTHYEVVRDEGGTAEVRLVPRNERESVLATMMSGEGTGAAKKAAKELLANRPK